MEAVLPLKVSGDWSDHDVQRARMLLFSLDRFWISDVPLKLHVIAKPNEVDVVRSALHATKIDISVVNEEQLVPALKRKPDAPGWYKQQVLKLAAHRLVSGDHYLLLDADLFACRPIGHTTLIVDGKVLADWEARAVHPDWWPNSGVMLGKSSHLEGLGLKPTPGVFVKSIAAELEAYLDKCYTDDGWLYLLQNLGWTEFTLYNLFCEMRNMMFNHYHDADWMQSNRMGVRSLDSFSSREQFEIWFPERSFLASGIGYFMVCNSSTRIPPGEIWAKLKPHFPASSAPEGFETSALSEAVDDRPN